MWRFLLLLCCWGCLAREITLETVKYKFGHGEYQPSGDGWAEARRRRLLRRFLEQQGFAVREEQQELPASFGKTKYRRVDLHARRKNKTGPSGKSWHATYVLLLAPDTERAALRKRQEECDRRLFAVLDQLASLETIALLATEECLGLTADEAQQN
ncbi:MAG: hypothetical protein N2Z22_09390 [Turneriella sp.]|nr:hypothetical protein [Turneriella sp.]